MSLRSLPERLGPMIFAMTFLIVEIVEAKSSMTPPVSSAAREIGSGPSSLLNVQDKDLLARKAALIVSRVQNGAVLKRACQLQRQQKVPPVSCFAFAKSTSETEELTDECLRLAPRALVLPVVDGSVLDTCRRAIESRRLDLKYVRLQVSKQSSDASR